MAYSIGRGPAGGAYRLGVAQTCIATSRGSNTVAEFALQANSSGLIDGPQILGGPGAGDDGLAQELKDISENDWLGSDNRIDHGIETFGCDDDDGEPGAVVSEEQEEQDQVEEPLDCFEENANACDVFEPSQDHLDALRLADMEPLSELDLVSADVGSQSTSRLVCKSTLNYF